MKTRKELQRARAVPGRANDLYADKSDAVAGRAGDTWETRRDGEWKPEAALPDNVSPEKMDVAKQAVGGSLPQARDSLDRQSLEKASRAKSRVSPWIDQKNLNRDFKARKAGASRERARQASRGGGRRRGR